MATSVRSPPPRVRALQLPNLLALDTHVISDLERNPIPEVNEELQYIRDLRAQSPGRAVRYTESRNSGVRKKKSARAGAAGGLSTLSPRSPSFDPVQDAVKSLVAADLLPLSDGLQVPAPQYCATASPLQHLNVGSILL